MGCLISFPTLPQETTGILPPSCSWCLPPLENSEGEGNCFFSLAGNLLNWKVTDFGFSESLSWTPTNKSPLQANLTGEMRVACLPGRDKKSDGREEWSLGSPKQPSPLLGVAILLPSSVTKKRRGKVLSGEVIPQTWSKNTNYPSCSCLFWGLKFKIWFFSVEFFPKEIGDVSQQHNSDQSKLWNGKKWLLDKIIRGGTYLGIQWLRLQASTAGGTGSNPGWGKLIRSHMQKKKIYIYTYIYICIYIYTYTYP